MTQKRTGGPFLRAQNQFLPRNPDEEYCCWRPAGDSHFLPPISCRSVEERMDLLHTIVKSTNFRKIQRKNVTCFINLMVFYNPTTPPPKKKKQDDHNITMWPFLFFHILDWIPYRAPKIQISIGKASTRPCPQIHGANCIFLPIHGWWILYGKCRYI